MVICPGEPLSWLHGNVQRRSRRSGKKACRRASVPVGVGARQRSGRVRAPREHLVGEHTKAGRRLATRHRANRGLSGDAAFAPARAAARLAIAASYQARSSVDEL